MFEREKPSPIPPPRLTPGDAWLRGYSDAYHERPPMVPGGRATAAAYRKGYAAGKRARG